MSTSRFRARMSLLAAPTALTLALTGCGSVPDSEVPEDVPDGASATLEQAPTTEDAAPTTDEAAPSTEGPAPTTDDAVPTTDDAAPTTDEAAPTTDGGGEDGTSGETGSLESPIPPGAPLEVGDWTVTIDSFEKDASDALTTSDIGNPGPEDGTQYSLLSLTATYNGAETGSAFIELWFELLGPDGVPTSDTEGEFCSAGPDDILSAPSAQPGDTINGQVCFIVANEDIDNSVLLVEELMSLGREGSYYVALE